MFWFWDCFGVFESTSEELPCSFQELMAFLDSEQFPSFWWVSKLDSSLPIPVAVLFGSFMEYRLDLCLQFGCSLLVSCVVEPKPHME